MNFNIFKKPLIFHPFLFSVYPILHIYFNVDRAQKSFFVILLPIVMMIFTITFLLFFGRKIISDPNKSFIIVSFMLVWFFSYAAFHSIPFFGIYLFRAHRNLYPFIFSIGILLVGLFIFYKVKINYLSVSNYLEVFSVILILLPIINYFGKINTEERSRKGKINIAKMDSTYAKNNEVSSPDIYYIILDSYTGVRALKENFNYDNRKFINYLINKDFFVATESRSNYVYTQLSLASSLNMEYLTNNFLGTDSSISELPKDVDLTNMIIDSNVLRFLKTHGYEFVNLSIWEELDTKSDYDLNYNGSMDTMPVKLLNMTILQKPLIENYLEVKHKRNSILHILDVLKNMNPGRKPKFIYAHLMVPHSPYAFDSNGNEPSYFERSNITRNNELGSYRDYTDQIIYINKEVSIIVEKLLTQPNKLPIIIIQGDHGTRLRNDPYNVVALKLRTSILNAYFFPYKKRDLLYNSITPVNSFRIVFNLYFDEHYPLLRDRNYYCFSETPHKFIDVTKMVEDSSKVMIK